MQRTQLALALALLLVLLLALGPQPTNGVDYENCGDSLPPLVYIQDTQGGVRDELAGW